MRAKGLEGGRGEARCRPAAVKAEHAGERGAYWEAVSQQWHTGRQHELWRRCSDAIHQMWLDRAAGAMRGALVLKTDLFDEAFGDGLAEWFEQRGNRVIGCDVAFSTAKHASERRNCLASVVSDVRHLPFGDERFDCVFSDSTLDHFQEEEQIQRSLEELNRVLRPRGTLLVTMDNPRHPLIVLRNLFPAIWQRLGIVPYSVGVTCSERRLSRMLEAAGFEVLETGAILHAPRLLVVACCGWIERRLGIHEPAAWWLRWLKRFELLGRLPCRQWTGHFVAAVARRSA
jgi:ubiquinone/menaquinone biosynthesis C-methylase UbiE